MSCFAVEYSNARAKSRSSSKNAIFLAARQPEQPAEREKAGKFSPLAGKFSSRRERKQSKTAADARRRREFKISLRLLCLAAKLEVLGGVPSPYRVKNATLMPKEIEENPGGLDGRPGALKGEASDN